jgi:hypothetical protein
MVALRRRSGRAAPPSDALPARFRIFLLALDSPARINVEPNPQRTASPRRAVTLFPAAPRLDSSENVF